MNLLVSFLIFTLIAWLATPFVGMRFFEVQSDSPASRAGLVSGDAILAVDGRQNEFFGTGSVLLDLRDNTGQAVTLTIEHPDGTIEQVPVTLRTQSEIDASKDAEGNLTKGPLGVSQDKTPFQSRYFGTFVRDLPTSISVGANETVRWFGVILGGLGDLARQVISNPTAAPPVSGPIGIATQISDSSSGPASS